jgi:hypothetical protein
MMNEGSLKQKDEAKHGGSHLKSQLLGQAEVRGSRFKASPSKKSGRPYLND